MKERCELCCEGFSICELILPKEILLKASLDFAFSVLHRRAFESHSTRPPVALVQEIVSEPLRGNVPDYLQCCG
jgi:hypothetical protein